MSSGFVVKSESQRYLTSDLVERRDDDPESLRSLILEGRLTIRLLA